MPVKSNTETWVLSIRSFIKDTLGTSWQIRESKGKVRLGVRYKDKSRSYFNLPYKWQRSNQGKIRDFIEQVHTLHVRKKVGIKEAIERVKLNAPQDEIKKASKTDFKLILQAWEKWGEFYNLLLNLRRSYKIFTELRTPLEPYLEVAQLIKKLYCR